MKKRSIDMIKVSEAFFMRTKKMIEENDMYGLSRRFPDEFGIATNRLDHIDINEKEIIFHDRGLVTSDGVFDMTFGCYYE